MVKLERVFTASAFAILLGPAVAICSPLWIEIVSGSGKERFEIDFSGEDRTPPIVQYPSRITLNGSTAYGRFQFDCVKWEMNLKVGALKWSGWTAVPMNSPGESMLRRICSGVSQPAWSLVAGSPKGRLWINEKSIESAGSIYTWNGTLQSPDQLSGQPLKFYLDCRRTAFNIKMGQAWGEWVQIPSNSFVSILAARSCEGK